MKRLTACLLLGGAVSACGGDAGSAGVAGGAFSCSLGFVSLDAGQGGTVVCVEGVGGTAQDYENNKRRCTTQGSTFQDAACPRANAIGGCRIHQGATTLTTWYYANGALTIDIQEICRGLGVEYVTP